MHKASHSKRLTTGARRMQPDLNQGEGGCGDESTGWGLLRSEIRGTFERLCSEVVASPMERPVFKQRRSSFGVHCGSKGALIWYVCSESERTDHIVRHETSRRTKAPADKGWPDLDPRSERVPFLNLRLAKATSSGFDRQGPPQALTVSLPRMASSRREALSSRSLALSPLCG